MVKIPATVPPLPRDDTFRRHLAPATAFSWLAAGSHDLMRNPSTSLAYGSVVCVASLGLIVTLFGLGWDYFLFPALAGFLVVAPILAIGLYEKSRRLARGDASSLKDMIFVQAESGGQVLFMGVVLSLLMLLWIRAAVIIYALFFGLRPFPGLDHIAPMLFLTPTGWAMLIVGTLVGGLFASFSFAIGVFSVPMLLDRRIDVFTAMGTSIALVWNNLPVMLTWGAIVVGLSLIGLATGTLGLIVIFPMLGHASWHAYKAFQP
jgi:uncharacterized membrane protein